MKDLNQIIESSLETLKEKKETSRAMSQVFKAAEEGCGVESPVLRRVKDYNYYKGNGWVGSTLVLDPEEKFKDRISPVFIKLVRIIDDLKQTDQEELLSDYLDELSELGIEINFSKYIPSAKTSSKETSDAAITTGVGLQKLICELSDEIKDSDSSYAEEQGFGPKREYVKLINLAYSKRKGKDISDKCQDACTDFHIATNSYQQINNSEF